MTICARGCVALSGSDRFAMDALLDIMSFFWMAGAAGLGLSSKIELRSRRTGAQDLMRIVTVQTRRRVHLTGLPCQSVNTRAVAFCFPWVARGAVHELKDLVVIWMPGCHVGMATDARIGAMNGSGQLGFIDKQRNSL